MFFFPTFKQVEKTILNPHQSKITGRFISSHSSQLELILSLYEFPTWWPHIVLYFRTDSNSCLTRECLSIYNKFTFLSCNQAIVGCSSLQNRSICISCKHNLYKNNNENCNPTPPDIKLQCFCRVHCLLLEYVSYVCCHLKSELLRIQCQLAVGKSAASTRCQ